MIEKLTKKQEEQLISHRDEWLEIGRSTEPMDKEKSSEAIKYMYKIIGKKSPSFWFCDSPFQAVVYYNLFKNSKKLLGANLWANLRDNLEIPSTYIYGSFDGYFPGYYKYAEKYLGLKYKKEDSKRIKIWENLSKSCGFIYTFENICFICDKPKNISVDFNGELHDEKSPCMEFRDGYKFYAIDGVRMPNWVFEEPKKLNVESIDKESNIEVRRILIDRYGVDKYLQEKQAEVVDFEVGENLTRSLIRISDEELYLCGHDGSTDRVYYMSVPPNSKSCKEAHENISFLNESLCVGQG